MIGKEMSCAYTLVALQKVLLSAHKVLHTISELENNVCFEFRNTTKNILEKQIEYPQ